MAVWKLLDLEALSDSYHPSPLYMRASELPDPAMGEPLVERVLFHDDCDYNTDVSNRQGRFVRKRNKGKHST